MPSDHVQQIRTRKPKTKSRCAVLRQGLQKKRIDFNRHLDDLEPLTHERPAKASERRENREMTGKRKKKKK